MSTTSDKAGLPSPALVGDLKQLVLNLMTQRLDKMFEGADGLLVALAEKSRNSKEQRNYFDAKVLVRQHRSELARGFRQALEASFEPGAEQRERKPDEGTELSLDDLQMARTRAIEESIAVSNIAMKAESQNEKTLFEVGRRLEYLIKERGAAASPQALAPATLCNAFKSGTQALKLDFQSELVFYKLFDQLVASTLNEVYGEALRLLEGGGVTTAVLRTAAPRKSVTRSGPSTPSPGPAGAAAGGGGEVPDWSATNAFAADLSRTSWNAPSPDGPATGTLRGGAPAGGALTGSMPAGGAHTGSMAAGGPLTGSMPTGAAPASGLTGGMPALDPRTLGSLTSAQGPLASVPANYGDADLASELSQLASGQAVAGWGPPQVRANLQRADLVGRMFNNIIDDAAVPEVLKPHFDELRFSVIKNALADPAFFTDAEHPVRRLIKELASLAAVARATGADSGSLLASLLAEVQSQVQVGARTVREAAVAAKPLAETAAKGFIDDQAAQARERRQALVERARKVVREELELRMKGRQISEAAKPVLMTGVAPLLGLRLLRKGMDSDAWRDGVALLERVLDALDPAVPVAAEAPPIEELCDQVERELLAEGMVAKRATELLGTLRTGAAAAQREREAEVPPAPPPAPPPEAPIALLRRLLVAGEWFKVHETTSGKTRWLKFVSHTLDGPPESAEAVFAEFSGKNEMRVKVEELLVHLAAGLSEPFDQSPGARAALAELIAEQRKRISAEPDFLA